MLSVAFIEYGQKRKQTPYLIDKAILGKMYVVYLMYVANADKGQWHVMTLVWSFKADRVHKQCKAGHWLAHSCFFCTFSFNICGQFLCHSHHFISIPQYLWHLPARSHIHLWLFFLSPPLSVCAQASRRPVSAATTQQSAESQSNAVKPWSEAVWRCREIMIML